MWKITRIGPLTIGMRRRERLPREWEELAEARDRLGRALLDTHEYRALVRLCDWLETRLERLGIR